MDTGKKLGLPEMGRDENRRNQMKHGFDVRILLRELEVASYLQDQHSLQAAKQARLVGRQVSNVSNVNAA